MKYFACLSSRFLFVLVFWGISHFLNATQVQFLEGNWKEILLKAQQENKPIFVNFYTSWGAPCQYMKTKVFTDSKVAEYYNQNFISFRINAEQDELELVHQIGVEVFPTLYFFAPNGEIIGHQTGATEPNDLLRFGKAMLAMTQADEAIKKLQKAYQETPQNREITAQYLQALMQANHYETAEIVANQYLNEIAIEDWEKHYNWQLIKLFVHDIDAKGFQYMLQNTDKFLQKYSTDFTKYMLTVLEEELTQVTIQQDKTKLQKLKMIYIQALQGIQRKEYEDNYYFNFIDLFYYNYNKDTEKYFQILKNWVEKYHANDWQELAKRAFELAENKEFKENIEIAHNWAYRALKLESNVVTNITMAHVLWHKQQLEEAQKYAEIALKINTEDDMKPYIERLIKKLAK